MNDEGSPQSRDWRAELGRSWRVPLLERLGERVGALSFGDRFIFYALAVALGAASLSGLYALERVLLVPVPAYGGQLVEGVVGRPQFINPLLAISDADRDLSALTHAGLMGISGSGSLVPVVAERYTISPDGKSYTFYLRENAQFSDGTPVTAHDVVFTVGRAQDPSLKSPEYASWSGVAVAALDQRTVQFTLKKPYAPFLGLTTLGILPARFWQSISSGEFPFSSLQTSPIGAGPFVVTRVARDASGLIKSVSLAANERFALGRPYLDGIRFEFYPRTEDLANALQGGVIGSAYDVPSARGLTAPYTRIFGVFWNPNETQVLARTEVRKALSFALDRDRIIAEVLGGYASAVMGPLPPGGNIRQTPVPAHEDPTAAAAETLRAGGWAYDAAERAWKHAVAKQSLGHLTLRTSNVPELKNIATAVKAQWERLGVRVDIELYEPGDLSQNVIRPRKYEALLYGEVIGRNHDLYAFWSSKERNDPGLNIALYANKTIDDLLENVRSSTNESVRASSLQKIEDIVAADYPAAFIYAPDFTYTVPANLRGVELPQIVVPADRFAAVASWYMMTDAVWPFFVRK